MKKIVVIFTLLLVAVAVQAQTTAVQTYAYSRTIIPGVPPGPDVVKLPPEYFIYVVLPVSAAAEVRGVWIGNRMHAATLQKVTGPVLKPENPEVNMGKQDVMIPATRNQIYRVFVGDTAHVPMATKQEDMMRSDYCVVVYLKVNKQLKYGRRKTIQELPTLRLG